MGIVAGSAAYPPFFIQRQYHPKLAFRLPQGGQHRFRWLFQMLGGPGMGGDKMAADTDHRQLLAQPVVAPLGLGLGIGHLLMTEETAPRLGIPGGGQLMLVGIIGRHLILQMAGVTEIEELSSPAGLRCRRRNRPQKGPLLSPAGIITERQMIVAGQAGGFIGTIERKGGGDSHFLRKSGPYRMGLPDRLAPGMANRADGIAISPQLGPTHGGFSLLVTGPAGVPYSVGVLLVILGAVQLAQLPFRRLPPGQDYGRDQAQSGDGQP